ncbi:M24 family metallopeptidase [Bosea sp. BH3]|uniref:M24 family metallopeptidase n=1 Tax=Bosea sp. BH3 TaxID=2871701 RepID=UPI0021CB3CB0|nr:Xaa-Pro peptidase family protein [Bosea sp. BH3]MCU4180400.1 Xaa-Pro peptidase family protein [Bosea sp. BH3]
MLTTHPIAQELFFPGEEYETRLATIRAAMARRGVDVMLCSGPENIFYASGYQTFGYHSYQLLVIPLEGKPFLILRYLESLLAHRYSWVTDIVTWDDTDDPIEITLAALKERGLAAGKVGVEQKAYFLQVSSFLKLQAALPGLVDGSGVVEVSRAIKSPRELAFMREAGKLSDIGMAAAIEAVASGSSDQDIAAECFAAMTRAGSEWMCRSPIVTTGDRSGLPHSNHLRQKLDGGDAVLIEISAVYNRYYSPLMRGALVGRSNPKVERIAAVCIEALEAAIDAVKPGATSGEVDEAARRVIEREGLWENYRKRSGYAVGVGFSTWIEGAIGSLKIGDTTVLKPGMCYHIPIAIRYYGEAGIGFSETVAVTETGVEVMGRAPRSLAIR